jgi:hypothetical protein
MVVRSADKNVRRRDARHLFADPVAKRTWKSEEIDAANCKASVAILKN